MSVVKFLLFNIFCFFFMRLFNDVWLYAQCSLINICIWKSLGCLGFSFDFPKSKEGNKEWIWWWESCSERPRIVIRGNSRVGKVSKFVNRKCLGLDHVLVGGHFSQLCLCLVCSTIVLPSNLGSTTHHDSWPPFALYVLF